MLKSYREVIHPVEEVIQLVRFYCQPQSQLGIGIKGLGLGLDKSPLLIKLSLLINLRTI